MQLTACSYACAKADIKLVYYSELFRFFHTPTSADGMYVSSQNDKLSLVGCPLFPKGREEGATSLSPAKQQSRHFIAVLSR